MFSPSFGGGRGGSRVNFAPLRGLALSGASPGIHVSYLSYHKVNAKNKFTNTRSALFPETFFANTNI